MDHLGPRIPETAKYPHHWVLLAGEKRRKMVATAEVPAVVTSLGIALGTAVAEAGAHQGTTAAARMVMRTRPKLVDVAQAVVRTLRQQEARTYKPVQQELAGHSDSRMAHRT